MNQIYQLTAMLSKALFKLDQPRLPDNAFPPMSAPGIILKRVRELLAERNVNSAENLLFDSFDRKQPVYMAIGFEFYASLSELSDDELEKADFSRDEVKEGLEDMLKFYNVKLTVKKNPNPPAQGASKPPVAPNVLADPPKKS